MPILVKDFTWTQTQTMVQVRVPLSTAHHEDIDLFTADVYIKANFHPFLFEIYLLHEVDIDKSKCIVKEDLILLDLMKKEEGEWAALERKLSKEEKMKVKQEVYERSQEKAKQEAEDKRIKKQNLDRFTVQQAMEIDTKQHSLMDSRRDEQRKMAMDALEEWRVNSENGGIMNSVKKADTITVATPEITASTKPKEQKVTEYKNGVKIVELTEDYEDKPKRSVEVKPKIPPKPVKTPVKSEFVEKKKKEDSKRVLPKLRETGSVEITHTPRTFPTPSRESVAAEEEAWLKNVTMARRATGFISEDLRPEEHDPQWCKEKGDEFFRAGNFLGAISAYSHGITLSDKLPSLYANRSAAHFALGNFNKCLNDCSTALDLLTPACEANRRSRAKCIARRAAALARIGYLTKAIDEMKAAAKMLPDDDTIKKDLYDMERAWEQNPDSD